MKSCALAHIIMQRQFFTESQRQVAKAAPRVHPGFEWNCVVVRMLEAFVLVVIPIPPFGLALDVSTGPAALLSTGLALFREVLKELIMNGKRRERRHGMPMAKAIFLTGIVAIMLIYFDSLASAEGDPQASLPANTQGTSEAPIDNVHSTFRILPMLKDLPLGTSSQALDDSLSASCQLSYGTPR
jgi:hypothetical protein